MSLEVNGNKTAEEDAKKITVINKADGKWTIEADGKVVARGTSVIDPTKKPKAVDLTVTEGTTRTRRLSASTSSAETPRNCSPRTIA